MVYCSSMASCSLYTQCKCYVTLSQVHVLTCRWYLGPSGVPSADVHMLAYARFCSGKLNLHILFPHIQPCCTFHHNIKSTVSVAQVSQGMPYADVPVLLCILSCYQKCSLRQEAPTAAGHLCAKGSLEAQ